MLGTSCEDALIVSNPNSLAPEDVLDKVSGFESVLLSAYNRVRDFGWYGRDVMVAPEVMADNLDFAGRTGRYETQYVNAVRAHMGRWGRYQGINNCNILIDQIDDLKDLSNDDIALRDRLKGEAFFLRALNYHDMARVYGYEPGQEVNGFNLTVPLRINATNGVSDALDVRARATNTELYQQIESDLTAAISFLPASASGGPYRLDQAAAHALLARVYLYWGRWADAAAQAEQAMSKTSATLIDTKAGYYDAWLAIPHPESIFEMEIRSVDWSTVDGVNNSLHSVSSDLTSGGQFLFISSPELQSLVQPQDYRDTIWTAIDGIPSGSRRCEKWRGEKGDFLENIPVLRYSEVMLTAIEGFARSGNETRAVELLDEFRAARGLDAVTESGQELIDVIMTERRVEFALEGHRWFDLKRLGMDIPKSAASQSPTLSYSDFRILGFMPESELNLNELLVQNPGY